MNRTFPQTLLVACALAAALHLAPGTCAAGADTKSRPTTLEGIPRLIQVEPGFARGGRPSDEGIRALAAQGYRTVVSLRRDDEERASVIAAGMDYVELPLKAGVFGATVPTEAEARAFLDVVADPARRPVFVHCKRGRDRTGVMVALWRVLHGGWTPEAAIAEMNERGMSAHYRNYRRFIRALAGAPTGA